MVCRVALGALHEFLKLTPEDIIHLQLAGDFFGYVQTMRAPRVKINFLKNEDVGVRAREEVDHSRELLPTVDVPIHNAQRSGRPEHQPERREVASDDFPHFHFYTVAARASWGKTFCWAKLRS